MQVQGEMDCLGEDVQRPLESREGQHIHWRQWPKRFLPQLRLRHVRGFPDPTMAQLQEVGSQFPGCRGVAYEPPFVVVMWATLPKMPWPLTIGASNTPVFFAAPGRMKPPCSGRIGTSLPLMTAAAEKILPMVQPEDSIFKRILASLRGEGIRVKSLWWMGMKWFLEVISHEDGKRLPSRICGLIVFWGIWKVQDLTRRVMVPRVVSTENPKESKSVIDRHCYTPHLRPGLLVASTGNALTTSGVPLKAPDGQFFFTVAAHGYMDNDNLVYHPFSEDGQNAVIGKVAHRDHIMDLGFVKLEPGKNYSCDLFDRDECVDEKLLRLVHSNKVEFYSTLTIDSPFNGHCNGTLLGKGFFLVEEGDNAFYHMALLVFFGNEHEEILPGACGSAVYNDDFEVVGFFKFIADDNVTAYIPSVDTLIESGFILQEIPLTR